MTTGCKIACHDNSTRGLDASTALEYTRALRIATDVQQLTTILSIYQCGENIFNNFDKVCLLYEGEMVYFGAMNAAVQYFIDIGYEWVKFTMIESKLMYILKGHKIDKLQQIS